jgi:hypothetical protein
LLKVEYRLIHFIYDVPYLIFDALPALIVVLPEKLIYAVGDDPFDIAPQLVKGV